MLVEEIKKLTEVKPELCEEEKTWVTSFANIDTVDEDKDKGKIQFNLLYIMFI